MQNHSTLPLFKYIVTPCSSSSKSKAFFNGRKSRGTVVSRSVLAASPYPVCLNDMPPTTVSDWQIPLSPSLFRLPETIPLSLPSANTPSEIYTDTSTLWWVETTPSLLSPTSLDSRDRHWLLRRPISFGIAIELSLEPLRCHICFVIAIELSLQHITCHISFDIAVELSLRPLRCHISVGIAIKLSLPPITCHISFDIAVELSVRTLRCHISVGIAIELSL
ncbi:unnamed protein product [Acanthosepion pharaonis]|uniref:Uncharacterized protein n=1 Tax=Acanthosepion pharaonis TaxID=158019 RepID=A0A812EH25_ACAPH|nr:unnamed protein product [Sepia pharaonis]